MNVDNMQNLNNLNSKLKDNDFAMWFYANWCGHCKEMESEWANVEKECKNKNISVVKVRDDFARKVKGGLGENIMGFPKIVMVSKGKEVAEHQGMRTSDEIMNTILKHLKPMRRRLRSHKRPRSSRRSKVQGCPKSRGKKRCGKVRRRTKNNMQLNKLFKLLNQKKSKQRRSINIRNLLK
jgi:thioredoxin-like negative regulator of GroEL